MTTNPQTLTMAERDALVQYVRSIAAGEVTCEWFATCDHDAVGLAGHAVLGSVPTCERCAARMGLDLTRPAEALALLGE